MPLPLAPPGYIISHVFNPASQSYGVQAKLASGNTMAQHMWFRTPQDALKYLSVVNACWQGQYLVGPVVIK
jgi:hypothetical protein